MTYREPSSEEQAEFDAEWERRIQEKADEIIMTVIANGGDQNSPEVRIMLAEFREESLRACREFYMRGAN